MIPKEINKSHIEAAIDEIDPSKIPMNRNGKDYFIESNDKLIPVKYLISIANKFPNGYELNSEAFNTDEARIFLEKYNYKILKKEPSYFYELQNFLKQSKTTLLSTSNFISEFSGLNVKVGFGQGSPAKISWIAFLNRPNRVQEGIYPVYLFFKDLNKLILAYGVSETMKPKITWELDNSETIKQYFAKFNESPFRYGDSFVFKIYDPKDLDKETVDNDLNEILKFYKGLKINIASSIPNFSLINPINISIKTKPFIILAGISGTGKSRLVRKLAYDFCTSDLKIGNKPGNFELVKVKPNWHDSSELLGYESRVSGKDKYIVTDFIKFIVNAWKHTETPFFLCLDEMNLAPIEQYFAEYLSVIETRDLKDKNIVTDAIINKSVFVKYNNSSESDTEFKFWSELNLSSDKDSELRSKFLNDGLTLPPNLIVMGTVNMDETTHSFSRKVLDRAMTIELNVSDLKLGLTDEKNYWEYPSEPLDRRLIISEKTEGKHVFEALGEFGETIIKYLIEINKILEGTAFKIAYRVRDEFLLYAYYMNLYRDKHDDWVVHVLDEMTLMKILPRIEGDEEKTAVLIDLIQIFDRKKLEKSSNKARKMESKRQIMHYTSYWD